MSDSVVTTQREPGEDSWAAAAAARRAADRSKVRESIVILDFGSQYSQLIARRVREARVYSEILPHTATVGEIVARRPKAIILSGGPQSVYADGAPQVDPALFRAAIGLATRAGVARRGKRTGYPTWYPTRFGTRFLPPPGPAARGRSGAG